MAAYTVTNTLTLDVRNKNPQIVRAKQYDKNTRKITIKVVDGDTVYNLSGYTVYFKAKTPDHRAVMKKCTVNSDGTATIVLDDDVLNADGRVKAEIELVNTNGVLSTMCFDIQCVSSACKDSDVTGSGEFSALTDALVRVEKLEVKVNTNETTRQNNENTRKTNETTRQNNETTRKNNETARQNAENTRNTNENTRKTNETTRQNNETTRKNNETTRQNNETARKNTMTQIQSDLTRLENELNTVVLKKQLGVPSTSSMTGVATLNNNGKIPENQLPSFVDDVLEGKAQGKTQTASGGYTATGFILTGKTSVCTPENGKIYVDTTDLIQYRWSGSAYVSIGSHLALGTTASTAFPGDQGKKIADKYVSSIKGEKESAYRKGDVVLTPANLGASRAEDTCTNLLNPTLKYYVDKGITISSIGNGMYTVNGTSTAASGSTSYWNIFDYRVPLTDKMIELRDSQTTLKLCALPNGGSTQTYFFRLYFYNSDNENIGNATVTDANGITLKIPKEATHFSGGPYVCSGYTANNIILKPMLTTNLSEKYTSAVNFASYSGDGELNKNVGELYKETRGSYTNIIPNNYSEPQIIPAGITCTKNSDGTYTVKGTATADGYIVVYRGLQVTPHNRIVEANKQYLLTNIDRVPDGLELKWDAKNDNNVTLQSCSITSGNSKKVFDTSKLATDSTWTNSIVYYYVKKGVAINTILKPMITEAITATEFVSYSGNGRLNENVADLFSNKVDKVTGKGLSTNDFTNHYKQIVDNLETGAVVGVKGNKESTYRTGDVNLTPQNIGAAKETDAIVNLVPYPHGFTLIKQTSHGVTWYDNGDGTVTATGTAEADSDSWYNVWVGRILKKGTYRLTGTPSGITANTTDVYLRIGAEAPFTYVRAPLGGGANVTLTEDTVTNLTIYVKHGNTVNNVLYKPMLTTYMNATYNDFVPYSGEKATLNANVADIYPAKKRTITNLIHLSPKVKAQYPYTGNGITATPQPDGSFIFNGTATARCDLLYDFITKPGVYCLTNDENGARNIYANYQNKNNGNWINVSGNSVDEKRKIVKVSQADIDSASSGGVRVVFYVNANEVFKNTVFKPMLCRDLSATYDDYVPYSGCGELNENVANIHHITRGNITNLVQCVKGSQTISGVTITRHDDGSYTFNGKATADTNFIPNLGIGFKPTRPGRYKITGCPKNGWSSTYMCFAETELGTAFKHQLATDYGDGAIFNFTQAHVDAGLGLRFTIKFVSGVSMNNVVFKPMICEDLSADYDDYTPWVGEHNKLNDNVAALFDMFHPVGTLYETMVSTFDPNTAPGWHGTWERIKDRFIYACGDNQTVGSTGGSNTHTLTVAELPSHAHGLNNHTHTLGNHSHTLSNHTHTIPQLSGETNTTGNHSHSQNVSVANSGSWNGRYDYGGDNGNMRVFPQGIPTEPNGNHNHTVTTNASTTGGTNANTSANNGDTGAASGNTANTGSGTAIDIRPAYIRAYIWRRTN